MILRIRKFHIKSSHLRILVLVLGAVVLILLLGGVILVTRRVGSRLARSLEKSCVHKSNQ
jgi:hypothetical protein